MSELFSHRTEAAALGILFFTASLDGRDALALLDASGLTEADFHYLPHAHAFRGAHRLLRTDKPLTEATWTEILRTSEPVAKAGGFAFVARLARQPEYLAQSFPTHAKTLRSLKLRRDLLKKSMEMALAAQDFNVEPEGVALEGSAVLASLGAAGASGFQTMGVGLMNLMDELQAVANGTREVCIATGIRLWDEVLGGLQSGVITFVGAQPSVGKSALIGTMMENLAMRGVTVGLFSLEDNPQWLPDRIVARRSGIPVRVLKAEPLSPCRMQSASDAITAAYAFEDHVVWDGRSGLSGAQVAAAARQMVVQRGCKAIFLDHVGELQLDDEFSRNDLNLSAAIRALRDVAKDLRIPVVVLAHFRRPRGNSDAEPRYMRPTSAMWADSAGIERMARVGVGLWLHEGSPNEVQVTVLKQTNGAKDIDFSLGFNAASGLVASHGGSRDQRQAGYDGGDS